MDCQRSERLVVGSGLCVGTEEEGVVGERREELVHQIAMGGMNPKHIKTRVIRSSRSFCIGLYDLLDIFCR